MVIYRLEGYGLKKKCSYYGYFVIFLIVGSKKKNFIKALSVSLQCVTQNINDLCTWKRFTFLKLFIVLVFVDLSLEVYGFNAAGLIKRVIG